MCTPLNLWPTVGPSFGRYTNRRRRSFNFPVVEDSWDLWRETSWVGVDDVVFPCTSKTKVPVVTDVDSIVVLDLTSTEENLYSIYLVEGDIDSLFFEDFNLKPSRDHF